jgi:preprotein translocase subunit YajC
MPEFVLFGFISLLVLGAYWALVVYPKQRDFQKRQRYVSTLNPGEEVITYGGIIGKIVEVEADKGLVHIEIASGIIIRFVTVAVMQAYNPEELAEGRQSNDERPLSSSE